jgi:hypothetical protein
MFILLILLLLIALNYLNKLKRLLLLFKSLKIDFIITINPFNNLDFNEF